MNVNKIIWGLVLLAVGSVLLADNLGIIAFDWRAVFRLWPVVVIVMGLNMLMPERGVWRVIIVLISLVAIAFLIYMGIGSRLLHDGYLDRVCLPFLMQRC